MKVTVTILDDNIASPRLFRAEHGLSVLVDVDGRKFLWDCGQSDVAVYNARLLGLDLKQIEGVGISHGHYDHAGGLLQVLRESGPKKVFMHPAALTPKYFKAGQIELFIGVPFSRDAIEGISGGLELHSESVEVMPGVYTTGEIERVTDFEGLEPTLCRLEGGKIEPDPLIDDMALVVDTPEGAVVLTGCAHSGVVNILKQVAGRFGRLRAVIGGTHLGLGSADRLEPTLEFLDDLESTRMIFCHCTGVPAISKMIDRYGDRFTYGHAGLMMEV
jgi:7,8-dihydropterin-6-yl-methyl-4-(beta-D-ribofuranosyl)aminobenzene 5'-phosphate synthase